MQNAYLAVITNSVSLLDRFSKSARPSKIFGVDLIPKGSDPSMSMTGGLAGRSPEWRPQWTCYA